MMTALQRLLDVVEELGQHGDTVLAHISPKEVAMLKEAGGAGVPHPITGRLQFYDASTDGQQSTASDDPGGSNNTSNQDNGGNDSRMDTADDAGDISGDTYSGPGGTSDSYASDPTPSWSGVNIDPNSINPSFQLSIGQERSLTPEQKGGLMALSNGDLTGRPSINGQISWSQEYNQAKAKADAWNDSFLGGIAGFFGISKQVDVQAYSPVEMTQLSFNPIGTALGLMTVNPLAGALVSKVTGKIANEVGVPDVTINSIPGAVTLGKQNTLNMDLTNLSIGDKASTPSTSGNQTLNQDNGSDTSSTAATNLPSLAPSSLAQAPESTVSDANDLLKELSDTFAWDTTPLELPVFSPLASPHGIHADFWANRRLV